MGRRRNTGRDEGAREGRREGASERHTHIPTKYIHNTYITCMYVCIYMFRNRETEREVCERVRERE